MPTAGHPALLGGASVGHGRVIESMFSVPIPRLKALVSLEFTLWSSGGRGGPGLRRPEACPARKGPLDPQLARGSCLAVPWPPCCQQLWLDGSWSLFPWERGQRLHPLGKMAELPDIQAQTHQTTVWADTVGSLLQSVQCNFWSLHLFPKSLEPQESLNSELWDLRKTI